MKSNHGLVVILYNAVDSKTARSDEAESFTTRAVAGAVARAMLSAGYRVTRLPIRGSLPRLVERLRRMRPAVVINLAEGFRGSAAQEAQLAGLLELMDIPLTGSPAQALSLCQDKFRSKAVLKAWGLPTPRGWLVQSAQALPSNLPFPLLVKPNAEDASIGINMKSLVRDRAALRRQVQWVIKRYGAPVLIEEYINGREFCVGVVENTKFEPLPILEIIFSDYPKDAPWIFGYNAKWKKNSFWYREIIEECPAALPARLAARLQRLAQQACAALQIQGYARVDLRLDQRLRPFIIELNPNPDTSPEDFLDQALTAAGIGYKAFWEQQVDLAIRRKKT